MTSTIVPTFDNYSPITPQTPESRSSLYTLQWRRGQLVVTSWRKLPQPYLPSVDNQQLLVDCLKHSPINLVSIDATLGETVLKFWAEACQQANKPIFLRIPSNSKLFKRVSSGAIWLQLLDRVIAALLLLSLMPMMVIFIILMQFSSPNSLFTYEWCVGEKGKLFRGIKFATNHHKHSNKFGTWLHQSGLEYLPQLWNILQGDMSFIGTRCWTLKQAINLSLIEHQQVRDAINLVLKS